MWLLGNQLETHTHVRCPFLQFSTCCPQGGDGVAIAKLLVLSSKPTLQFCIVTLVKDSFIMGSGLASASGALEGRPGIVCLLLLCWAAAARRQPGRGSCWVAISFSNPWTSLMAPSQECRFRLHGDAPQVQTRLGTPVLSFQVLIIPTSSLGPPARGWGCSCRSYFNHVRVPVWLFQFSNTCLCGSLYKCFYGEIPSVDFICLPGFWLAHIARALAAS